MESMIKQLEKQLQEANMSGDAAMNDLREQLRRITKEYQEFKQTAKKDYDQL